MVVILKHFLGAKLYGKILKRTVLFCLILFLCRSMGAGEATISPPPMSKFIPVYQHEFCIKWVKLAKQKCTHNMHLIFFKKKIYVEAKILIIFKILDIG